MKSLYNKAVWDSYCEKIENDFQLKTYPQFDPYYNFPKEKEKLRTLVSDSSLKQIASHKFLPFLKTLQKTPRYKYQVEKEEYNLETKIRPISFASHFDSYIYGFYSHSLNLLYQDYIHKHGFEEVVLAYRTDQGGKCNIQFAKEAFDLVKDKINTQGECSVIALDIKGYFDHIDHGKLKDMWCNIIDEKELPFDQYKVFRSLTKYSYVNYNSFLKHFNINLNKIEKKNKRKTKGNTKKTKPFQSLFDLIQSPTTGQSFHEKMELLRRKKLIAVNSIYDKVQKKQIFKNSGIPQGSSMSALLSNIYLSKFDEEIHKKGKNEGFSYRRYCDDLLIICDSSQANNIKNYIMTLINKEYKLTIQDKKTEVLDFKMSPKGKVRSYRRVYNETIHTFDSLPNTDSNFKNLQYLGFEFNGQNIYIRAASLSRYFRKMKARIAKTISMAYSKNSKSKTIFLQQLFSRYSHFGKRNFLRYAYNASLLYYKNASGQIKEGLNSPSIKRQLSAHMSIIYQEIHKTSGQRAIKKNVTQIK